MGRRTALLLVAALVAVLGSGMVFLYVKGADDRAKQAQKPVQVLKAVAEIAPGESLAQAQSAGKLTLGTVPHEEMLTGAVSTLGELEDDVALTRIFPGEQITASKFGTTGSADALNIPDGDFAISVNLSDTGRVANFVDPGSDVAIFVTTTTGDGVERTRLLLPSVKVVGVGDTTMMTSTTSDGEGGQTTETAPRTLFTLAVDQEEAQKVMFASTHGELTFGLLTDKSKVEPGPGITASNLFG